MHTTTNTGRRSAALAFARHYAEMVVAMVLGMVVLGGGAAALLGAVGVHVSDWEADAPALMLAGMALTMTVPMVAWMRFRGHGWAPSAEMSASMILPTAVAIGLLATGAVGDTGALLGLQHAVMLPAMLVAMLIRVGEYTGHGHHAREHAVAA